MQNPTASDFLIVGPSPTMDQVLLKNKVRASSAIRVYRMIPRRFSCVANHNDGE
jgi:hypothetical protein